MSQKSFCCLLCCTGLFFLFSLLDASARQIPGHDLPVPETASRQLQNKIAEGLPAWWKVTPATVEEWQIFRNKRDESARQGLSPLLQALDVKYAAGKMGGVPVYTILPARIPTRNENRVLLHLHGGGYVLNKGEAGLGEAILMAALGGFKVVSADYRLAPEFPYPAALEDALAVYKTLLKSYQPANIGVFGTSTGGGMTLALILAAKAQGLPVPGAIACGTPWTDLTKTGDSYFTNEQVDNVLGGYDGWLRSAAKAYAGSHDMREPLLSPVYGDMAGFPPTILAAGTRDLFLSNTVRMHRKLREAGIPADLVLVEGLSHAQYLHLGPDAPETVYYFRQLGDFFERNLK